MQNFIGYICLTYNCRTIPKFEAYEDQKHKNKTNNKYGSQTKGRLKPHICHFSSENEWAIWSRQRERGFANTCRQHQQKIHMNMKEDIRGYAAHLKYDFAPASELHRISDLALRKRNFLRL